ncbi:Ribosomal protein L38e [Spironucleus salmonicida]|uniref:Ribosomal protein L38 n=1 Tax=Spironucleus salmonicida TaxID=348837 RepID=V6LF50_9EUKA|nr:Ribosomal protein L38e [Spironucleus salmonicida]|eukprot:EST42903.1 Ribosomal protein L38 [Spironucleus salmonicida]
MPIQVNQEQFMKLVTEKKASQLRVKRINKGNHAGWMKLKLRTPKSLCTLVVKDPNQAKQIVKSCSSSVQVVKVRKNGTI